MSRPTSGPVGEMMARAGFSAERIRATARTLTANFLAPGSIGSGVTSDRAMLDAVDGICAVADAMDRDGDAFAVDVDYTDRTIVDGAFVVFTRRVDVLASGPNDAALAAAQLVASLRDHALDGMVVATRIVGVRV